LIVATPTANLPAGTGAHTAGAAVVVVVGGAVVVVTGAAVVAGTVDVGAVVAAAGAVVTTAVEVDVFELEHEASNIVEITKAIREMFFTP
jgi:hypothetical protein